MKKKKLTFLFISVIFISVLFMSIGYSSLNSELTISSEAKVEVVPDIRITNIEVSTTENGAFTPYNPTFNDLSSNISVTLPNSNSTITLNIEVTNDTNNYYRLDNILEDVNNNSDIKYEILNKETTFFHPNSVTNIVITFSYETYNASNQNKNLELTYNLEKIPYKNLEYLVFSGFEYINTGLFNTGDYIFETEFNQTEYNRNHTDNSVGGWIISGRKIGTHSLGVFIGNYGVYNSYGAGTAARQPNIPLNSGFHTLYFSRFIHTIDNNNYVVNGKILIPEEHKTEIRIGGGTGGYYASSVPDTRHFIGHIKNVKITDASTGNVVRYYVPCEIISGVNIGEIGYWDLINNEFYGNGGTGEFLAP